ncbi:thermonuclease family protein [Halorhabdus rudnickae]|uniref:thermonuclease family protein n=1 Tax=Halorhabdus rudnickae TaxID=1775544 RepID=UPI001082D5C1|nr:hypothetical protein [Halorhabdus rudnickae]
MRRRVVAVVIAGVVLAGCTGLPESGPDAQTATSPAFGGETTVEMPSDGSSSPTVPSGDSRTATVVEVVDGDTMEIEYANGTRETIRLLGVDTSEPYAEVAPGE